MHAKPLISIALAAFNGSEFICKQIDSILDQSYSNFELIVSDDCSDDNTIELVRAYSSDKRIMINQNKKNVGYKRNFEIALSMCSGDYIALSDQDDIWDKNKLEELLFNIGDFDLIHSDAKVIDEKGNEISSSFSKYSSKSLDINPLSVVLNPSITGCTCMFNARILKKILPFPDGDYVHDRWISFISSINQGITYLDRPLVSYRQHSGNVSGAANFSWNLSYIIQSLAGFNRSKGIIQHFKFGSILKDLIPEDHYMYNDKIGRAHV